jgi:CDP-glucose 4,6-dehydratase
MEVRKSTLEDLGMNPAFWQGKRVFLTGHTGFKGSWLSLWLQSLGAEVTGYALNPPTEPSLFEVAKVANGMKSIIGDIRHIDSLQKAIQDAHPEVVIHRAAQPLVRYSYVNPVETYATNVMGSVHLLEVVRNTKGVRAVVNVTSDKCYENRDWVWGYREDETMGGYDPYSNSKGCAELVTASYRSSFFNPEAYSEHGVAIASARAGNVIGGGDWAGDRLIPDFIRAIVAGEMVIIRNPNAIRPWQHVLESLSGYLLLAENLYNHGSKYAEAWNFGPADSDAKSVEWIISQLVLNWGEGASFMIDHSAANLHEAHFLKLDCSKARMQLDWVPQWDSTETIKRICFWYKAYLNGQNMKVYTLSEIEQYQAGLVRV